jgi:hypothetical protein
MTEGNQQCTTNECQHKTKQIASASMDGTMKKGRPGTTWKNEVEDDLSIMGIKRDRRWPEIVESEGIVLETKVQNRNVFWWRRRRRIRRRRGRRRRRRGRRRRRKEKD